MLLCSSSFNHPQNPSPQAFAHKTGKQINFPFELEASRNVCKHVKLLCTPLMELFCSSFLITSSIHQHSTAFSSIPTEKQINYTAERAELAKLVPHSIQREQSSSRSPSSANLAVEQRKRPHKNVLYFMNKYKP